MTVYLNGKKVSKSRQRSLIGWTDYRCPVKDCFTIIINNSPTAKYKVSAHKRKHTMEAMKKPQYKIGDYVEFECKEIYFNGRVTIENKKGFIYFIDHESKIGWSIFKIKTRSGKYYLTSKIIRKLPILRDKNGRFCKKDCSCFNCNQCAEQMRAYYEKTGELKPSNVTKGPVNNSTGGGKTTETVTEDYMYTLEFGQMPYDEFGSRVKTEEKKPSDRIDEIYRRIETMFSDNRIAMIAAIGDYLDEQWEKEKAK